MKKSTNNEPRGHHVISHFYLGGFTEADKLVVIDKEKLEIRTKQNPKNLEKNRDFNRIDYAQPFIIEKTLSEEEEKAAEAIRNVSETKIFNGKDKERIIQLMALFHCRNLERRGLTDSVINELFQTHSEWIKSFSMHNILNEVEVTPELKEYFGTTRAKAFPNQHTLMELGAISQVVDLLLSRKWILVETDMECDFITSNSPFILGYSNIQDNTPESLAFIGLARLNTFAYFPLTRKMAVIGTFEGEERIESKKMTQEAVGFWNYIMSWRATKKVYSPHLDFYLLLRKNEQWAVDQFDSKKWLENKFF